MQGGPKLVCVRAKCHFHLFRKWYNVAMSRKRRWRRHGVSKLEILLSIPLPGPWSKTLGELSHDALAKLAHGSLDESTKWAAKQIIWLRKMKHNKKQRHAPLDTRSPDEKAMDRELRDIIRHG